MAALFDDVKYNDVIRRHVADNKYNLGATLKTTNDNWGSSKPIADRKIIDFPSDAVMLKPVYAVVSGANATILHYWAGPANSSKPDVPDSSTWTKRMVVVPFSLDPKAFRIQDAGIVLPAVSVNDFYHFKLTKDEADALNQSGQLGQEDPKAKEGDYAILVAMHVSSREIDNWTWQTFWWSLDKPSLPKSAQGRVIAPFDHYQIAVGYSFLTDPKNPAALTLTCYNPYLEAGFGNTTFDPPNKGQLGIESNCMSCHRAAAWPRERPNRYVANGVIDPADPVYFAGKTKTDFLWGIPNGVKPPPSKP